MADYSCVRATAWLWSVASVLVPSLTRVSGRTVYRDSWMPRIGRATPTNGHNICHLSADRVSPHCIQRSITGLSEVVLVKLTPLTLAPRKSAPARVLPDTLGPFKEK